MYLNNMNIDKEIQLYIKRHSLEESPNECCGIIIEEQDSHRAIRCENASQNKKIHFEISGKDFLKAIKQGKIAAYYHSHTEDNPEFSNVDKAISFSHKIPLIMYSIMQDKFFQFTP